MTIPSESFRLVNPSLAVNMYVTDWSVDDESILVPTATNALLLGEWLTITRTAGQARREDAHPLGGHLSHPFFSPRGAYDVQTRKIVPLIQHGTFVADTWVFDRTNVTTLGQELTAKLVAFEGANRSILTSLTPGTHLRRAIVLRLPGSATEPLRIFGNY